MPDVKRFRRGALVTRGVGTLSLGLKIYNVPALEGE